MADDGPNDAEIRRWMARASTLEQLVEVYERSVIEQSDKLYAEQTRMRFQKTTPHIRMNGIGTST